MAKLSFYIEEKYGTARVYPTGPAAGEVQLLIGKITVSQRIIDSLTRLGHEIEFVNNPKYDQFTKRK
jgi:hypothetical protein